MKFFLSFFIVACMFHSVSGQGLNLDMEEVDAYAKPLVWRMGHPVDKPIVYHLIADSVIRHGGRYSMKLWSNSDRAEFASSFMVIPVSAAAKTVTLKGFVKSENVQQGIATLYLSLMADDTTVVLWDNLFITEKALRGTKDWTELIISLPIKEKVTMISFGCILQRAGTVWVDDLTLMIDNIPIIKSEVLQPYIKDPQTGKMRKF